MSTNKTQHYQLHAWALGDEPPMSEFNENFTKLDAALKAEQTARSTGLAQKAEVVIGSYVGNDAEDRTISLGFTPKAIYLCTSEGCAGYSSGSIMTFGGLAFPGCPLQSGPSTVAMKLTGAGFLVHHYAYNVTTNSQHKTYYYVVFR